MSYILHSSAKLANELSHHPEILSLDHLDASHLPRCPVCGATMVNNGRREVKCKETDRIGNGTTNSVSVHRIKCNNQQCWIELGYIPFKYAGTNMYSSLFYRSAGEAAVIIGIDDVASRLGINVDDVKKAINCFCKESIKSADNAIFSFHIIAFADTLTLVVIDVTNKIIFDVCQFKNVKSLYRKIVMNCPHDRPFIIPEDDKLIEVLHQNYIENYHIEIPSVISRNRNYTTPANMVVIEAAHRRIMSSLSRNNDICNRRLKDTVCGYF